MAREFTYSKAGVDREQRAESKKALKLLADTFRLSRYGSVVQLPYGSIFPIDKNRYADLAIEGVGTKVLVAQLAEKYDTIGIDGVAMAVNDVIRSGAKPLAIADNIHMQVSNPALVKELIVGVAEGATEAGCIVPSGEIGDVAELIRGLREGIGFDLVVAAIGEVANGKIISGKCIRQGDAIIGLRSSGIHSNGVSLARRILFKPWGGKFDPHDIPEGLDREVVSEVLEPTRIYVKSLQMVSENIDVKAAVHITGDAYLKFNRLMNFSPRIGFEFGNFDPQPIFGLIQRTASQLEGRITDEEMFKTFNMGWGFAIVVDRTDANEALDVLGKKEQADVIGAVTTSERIKVLYKDKEIILQ